MALYWGKMPTYTYRPNDPKSDERTGLKMTQTAPDARICSVGRYQSTRTVAWQLEEYTLAVAFGSVPAGMETAARAYAEHAVAVSLGVAS